MILKSKNILIISPEPWNHLKVSKHHYAIHLANRQNNVIFLNPPSHAWETHSTSISQLTVMDYWGFWRGLRHLPKAIRKINQQHIFRQIEKRVGGIDLVWSFDTSVFYDLDALPSAVFKILHVVDFNQDFMLKEASHSADLCLFNTRFIGEKLKKSARANCFFINHGYSIPSTTEPFSFTSQFHVNVGYAGNLDIPYIDWELIQQVVESHPEVGFHFAGTCVNTERLQWMAQTPNVQLVGTLDQAQLTAFYQACQILMIAYKADSYKEQLANPHKVLEYLGSGKPIVATFTDQYKDCTGKIMAMSDSNQEWPSIFDQVLHNLPSYSTGELENVRRAIALDNTYEKQLDRIEQLVIQHAR